MNLSTFGLFDQSDFDERGDILMYRFHVTLKCPRQATHADRAKRLQSLDCRELTDFFATAVVPMIALVALVVVTDEALACSITTSA